MGKISMDQIRARRATSVWTRVHPVFALGQLGAFVVSICLLGGYFAGWVSFSAVHESVLVKIALMVGAVVSGAFWERDVFGHYWFAPEFFYEDAMTVNVFLLHLGYLAVAYSQPNQPEKALTMLVIAYAVYVANVAQYVLRTHKMSRPTVAVRVQR